MPLHYYGRAESVAQRILDAFEHGAVPTALAQVFIAHKDHVPCRAWSWGNQLLAALAGTVDARGYRQWQAVGRHVKKGASAFYILVPCLRKIAETDEATGEAAERRILYGFKSAAVFALEDTEGCEVAGPMAETADWIQSLPLREVAESWGLTIGTYDGKRARFLGYYRPGSGIALGVRNLATWTHELTHAADDRLTHLTGAKPTREVVAELGGATLLECLGQDTEADRGGAWEYVQRQVKDTKTSPLQVCQQVLKRTCLAVALILETAETLQAGALHVGASVS